MDEKCVYVFGMIVKGLIESMGMVAENKWREQNGETIAYGEEAFQKVLDDNGIHHNSILENLRPQL